MPRLTPNAAADRSGQSRTTIIRAIAAGELAATKHGNRWAIAVEDLDLWTAQRPMTAGRSAEGRFQKGEAPEPAYMPLRGSESAADGQKGGLAPHARLEALEALCAALQAEVGELRGRLPLWRRKRLLPPLRPAWRRNWPPSGACGLSRQSPDLGGFTLRSEKWEIGPRLSVANWAEVCPQQGSYPQSESPKWRSAPFLFL